MNNNEHDLILEKKIEKREKFDTILAYILLVVLLGCILLVLYLKFFKEEKVENPPVDEYVPTYISLSEISNSLNNSTLANRYMNDGVNFESIVSGNSMTVSYVKDDTNINLEMPMVGDELMISIPTDNIDIVTDIYKEIANIICIYYGNEEKYCRNTLQNITDEGTDGIRFDNDENNNVVYITMTKSIPVFDEILYKEVTISDIKVTNYSLQLLDIKVFDIKISSSDVSVVFTGNLEKLNDDTSNVSVVVKLYDEGGNVLGENKYEFNEENPLGAIGSFEINFILSETLKLEDIVSYTIEIIK